jgi:hypothetical protein
MECGLVWNLVLCMFYAGNEMFAFFSSIFPCSVREEEVLLATTTTSSLSTDNRYQIQSGIHSVKKLSEFHELT